MRALGLTTACLGLAGCDLSLHLDELDRVLLQMTLTDAEPITDFTLAWQAPRCAELSESVVLTLEAEGATPTPTSDFAFGRRGGYGSGGFAGLPLCENFILLDVEVGAGLARAEAVDFVVRDEARDVAPLTATLASPFVARRADFSPPPPWAPGDTVGIRWTPETDVIDTLQVRWITDEGFQATGSSGAAAVSFTVPEGLTDVRQAELGVEWRPLATCDTPLECTVRGVSLLLVDAPLGR